MIDNDLALRDIVSMLNGAPLGAKQIIFDVFDESLFSNC